MCGGIRYAAEESRDLEDLEEIKKVDRESLERLSRIYPPEILVTERCQSHFLVSLFPT